MYKEPKYITNEQIKHITPTNVRHMPIVIAAPKVNPKRDDKVTRL